MTGLQSIPIGRGQTGYQGAAIDTSNLLYEKNLGDVRVFNDTNPNTQARNSGFQVKCVLLRNKHNAALTPGQAIKFSTTTPGESGAPVSAVTDEFGVVDEYLPAAGVPVNDVFWCVLDGPTTVNIVTKSGAAAAGQLRMQASATSGKLDFIDLSPDDSTEAMNQAIYARAVTEGAIADGATTARVYLTKNPFGQ